MAFSLLNSKALVNTQIRYFLLLAYRVNWLTEVSGNESVIFESYSLNKDLNLWSFCFVFTRVLYLHVNLKSDVYHFYSN